MDLTKINLSIHFFVLVLLVSCSQESSTIHPTEENLNPQFEVINTLSDSNAYQAQAEPIKETIDRITNYSVLFKIGKLEGSSYEMLGDVKDVIIDEVNSRIYVLDVQDVGINVFDINGNYLDQISREGRGPGELTSPESMEFRDSVLYVLDNNLDIKMYTNDGLDIAYDKTIMTNSPSPPDDFCLHNGTLFVNAMTVASPSSQGKNYNSFAYEFGKYQEPLFRFGTLYKSNFWGLVRHLSMGGITCTESSNTVVQYFDYMNLIYGYEVNKGDIAWITRVPQYNYLKLQEKGGAISPNYNNLPINADVIVNTVSINEDYFLVQAENRTLIRGGSTLNKIESYLISYEEGEGIMVPKELPLILDISNQKMVLLVEEEFPKLVIAEY